MDHRHTQRRDDPIRLIADTTAGPLARHILASFLAARARVTDDMVYRGLSHGNLAQAFSDPIGRVMTGMNSAKMYLANAHMQAHQWTDNFVRVRKIEFDLNSLPQPTQDMLDDFDASMVRQVDDDTRETIAQVMARGTRDGWSIGKLSRALRGSIGLTDSQENTVANYRSLLENGSAEALDRGLRDRRFDPTVQRAIDGTVPLGPDMVDRLVGRYEDNLLQNRAETIARYETLSASNQGSFDALQGLIDDGTYSEDQITKSWMIAQDEATCERCRSIVEIQPDGVGFNDYFSWMAIPHGKKGKVRQGQVLLAPLHPNCRCTNGYQINGGDQ